MLVLWGFETHKLPHYQHLKLGYLEDCQSSSNIISKNSVDINTNVITINYIKEVKG